MQKKQLTPSSIIFAIGAIIILVATFWLQVRYLMWGDWDYDEGFYLLVAHLIDKGFAPYREISMSEPPMMVWSVDLPLQLFGSVWGMRFAMVCFTLIGVAATIWLGRMLDSPATALIAGALLAFNYSFFVSGRGVDAGVSSTSLALLAMGLALYYRTSDKKLWLLLSAIAMAASFLIKIYMAVAVLMIALTLIFHPFPKNPNRNVWASIWQERKRLLSDYLIWSATLFFCIFTIYVAYGFSDLLEQTVLFHLQKSAAYPYNLGFNLAKVGGVFVKQPLLSLLGGYGLLLSIYRFKKNGWFFLSWTLLTLIFLMIFNPLRGKHLIMLYPLVAILAGSALNHTFSFWYSQPKTATPIKWALRIAAPILLIFLLVEIVTPFQRLAKPVKPFIGDDQQPIVAALQQFTSPNDCIVTDDPYLAIAADRMPPPWLSNLSYARFESGSLDTQDLIEITNQYGCQAIVPTFARLKSRRDFYDLAKAHYLRVWVVNGAEIMLGKPLTQANPTIPLYANFSNQVELIGADWVESNSDESRQAHISLYWRKLEQPFTQNYKIFVQLRDATGQTLINADHEAFGGLVPTQSWRIDTITKDTNRLLISENVEPGRYALYIGLYDPATLERLPIINDHSAENAAIIPDIVIQ